MYLEREGEREIPVLTQRTSSSCPCATSTRSRGARGARDSTTKAPGAHDDSANTVKLLMMNDTNDATNMNNV